MLMLKEKRHRGKKKQKEGFSNKAIKYRLYPTKDQLIFIHKTIGCCRLLWNLMLTDRQKYYKETGKTLKPTPTRYKNLPEYTYYLRECYIVVCCFLYCNYIIT